MLTPQQIQQMNQVTGMNKPVNPSQTANQARAQQILAIAQKAKPQQQATNPIKGAQPFAQGNEVDSFGAMKQAFNQGATTVNEGVNQMMKPGQAAGNLPLGALKAGGGLVEAAFSPIAPAMKPVGDVSNRIAEKIGDNPTVQKIALSNQGDYIQKGAEAALHGSEIAGAIAGGVKAPEASASLKETATNIKNDLTPKGPSPQEMAANKAQEVASQKQQAVTQAQKSHDLIDKEIRNTAEKYPTVGTALNNAEVVRGTEPIKVIASYPEGKALPTMTKGGKMNSIPAVNFLKTQISQLGKLKENLVGTAKANTSIADFKQATFDRIDKSSSSLTKKAADKADVAKIIDGMESTYPDGIPATELDKIKTEQANESKSYNSKSPFSADAHALVGQTAADAVITHGGEAPIDELNKLLSSHYEAVKVLKAMHGKTPHGGMFSRHMGGIAGEVAGLAGGLAVGHPFIGAMAGRGASELVNNILSNHFISNPLKRSLITGMKGEKPEVIQKALDYIDSTEGSQAQTPTESTDTASQGGEKSTSPQSTTKSPKAQGEIPKTMNTTIPKDLTDFYNKVHGKK